MFFDRGKQKNGKHCCSSAPEEHVTDKKPRYGSLFTVTCEGSPYQLRDGDIIRDKESGEWYMVESVVMVRNVPDVVVTPYKTLVLHVDESGEIPGFEHVFIHQFGSYPIRSIDNDVEDADFLSPELAANPILFDQLA